MRIVPLSLIAVFALIGAGIIGVARAQVETPAGAPGATPPQIPGKYCTSAPQSEWLTIGDIDQMLRNQGYVPRQIEIDDRCFEAEVIDAQGRRLEMYLDPISGAVTRSKEDD